LAHEFVEEWAGGVGSERGFALGHCVNDCDSEPGATQRAERSPKLVGFVGLASHVELTVADNEGYYDWSGSQAQNTFLTGDAT
jgi:hypothetical protein